MKLTKSDLKNIVKECLVEILNEGLSGAVSASDSLRITTQTPGTTLLQHNGRQGSYLESKKRHPAPSFQMKETVRRESGGNNVMADILADTAASTLPKMLESEYRGAPISVPGGMAEQVVASTRPEDLFGSDVASKWADLAFSSSPKKL
jgi:hypothetical protein